ARMAGGGDREAALPLAAGRVAALEIEPPPAPAPGGPPRRAPRAALAVMAALLALGAASVAVGHGCASSQPWRRHHRESWRVALLGPAAALPYAALAAWGAWARLGLWAGAPLHRWTAAYAAGAAAAAALLASRPWVSQCTASHADAVHCASCLAVLFALKTVTQALVALKLEELQQARLARAVRALAALALLAGALAVAAMVCQTAWDPSGAGGFWWRWYDRGLGCCAACHALACLCGVGGLLGAAARALLGGRGGSQRRAGCFVLLTAGSLATSFATFFALLNYVDSVASIYKTTAVDGLFDCCTVALFSGLVGPAFVRVLAREAFSAINSYTESQLQEFYEKYLEYLDRAHIRWVRCGYLRHLAAAGVVMPRCQEVPGDQVFVGSRGFPLVHAAPKERLVVSHPWLAKEHPDPTGEKLRLLVRQLDMLHASDDHAGPPGTEPPP
ncbi:unnamed protein product, partial [Prorocentrum cordatum]